MHDNDTCHFHRFSFCPCPGPRAGEANHGGSGVAKAGTTRGGTSHWTLGNVGKIGLVSLRSIGIYTFISISIYTNINIDIHRKSNLCAI